MSGHAGARHGNSRKANALVAAGAALMLLGGCAADPFLAADASRYRQPVELADTPFFPQDAYQCGPAALATLLRHSGLEVTPDELIPKVYLPARRGSLQPEMLAASRGFGRVPYVIAPSFAALLAEVEAGRPVLVLQNLGISALPVWHYAVVVGYSPAAGEVILRSGRERRRVTRAPLFAKTWARSGRWGMLVLAPGELPAGDEPARYVSAVAGLEATGRLADAETAYRAALARWPGNPLVQLGLGNTAFAAGRAADAERWYRRALAGSAGDSTLLNNLAAAVAAQGRCREAGKIIARAEGTVAADNPLSATLAETRREIDDCAAARR